MTNPDSILPPGAYETPVTRRIQERIDATKIASPSTAFAKHSGSNNDDPKARYIEALSRSLADKLATRLAGTKSAADRVELVNQIAMLVDEDESINDEQLLYAVHDTDLAKPPSLPDIPLTGADLLTNAPHEHNMSSEIRREIETADSVDLLSAFIKNSGISVLHNELMRLKERGAKLRVITSTYMGATDAAAVKRLVEKYDAEVRIGYESKTTRLHAKAWLFHRRSGFDTAYIGSSNLSKSALVDGIEWNVRTSRSVTPTVIRKFKATFDTYWHDPHFSGYQPERDTERLEQSLNRASRASSDVIEISGLRVEPYPYQQAMLESLSAEREVHDRHKNLIVAATGTGKTVVAALDYRKMVERLSGRPSLLFIAHRKEILTQALRTYREVLRDSDFGELLVDGELPTHWNHVFASIQSLNQERLTKIDDSHFEVIVIDEFHHAEASTYRRVLNKFNSQELLGLTATPERADGNDVREFFDYRTAYELRLWNALQLQLLAPMHYFGINDETDLRKIGWNRRTRDYNTGQLGDFYIMAGEQRVKLIISEMEKRVFDWNDVKGLGFCVNVRHAEYMADQFNHIGIPAQTVTGQTPSQQRSDAIRDLRQGRIQMIFAVDVFNEGVDIPEVNTVLLLRPTQSATIFLQQLGRGLRLHDGKDVCQVFDFIGQQHENFNFENRFHALTGFRRKRLERAIQQGFPGLPAGTNIVLDRVSQERVLRSVRNVSTSTKKRLQTLLRDERTTNLADFLVNTGTPIEDIYRIQNMSWTRLLRETDIVPGPIEGDSEEKALLRRLRTLLHVNDVDRAKAYIRIACPNAPSYEDLNERDRTYARMLVLSFWGNPGKRQVPSSFDEALEVIRLYPVIHNELREIFRVSVSSSRRVPSALPADLGQGALHSHADYTRGELLAALDPSPITELVHLSREGVEYFNELHLDLFLVTLNKDDDSFSDSTSYKDYPISPDLFHWESQSSTTLSSETAQRYIHHRERGSSVLLAVRNTKQNDVNSASAYSLLGQVDYVWHQNEKPIEFEWALERPMPNQLYTQGRAVV